MKFLIAGFGSTGHRHFMNLKALGQEDLLVYRTGKSTLPADRMAALEGQLVETDLQAALAHKPDAVIVSNPTALHMSVAIPAAQAGCHLLIEKPLADALAPAEELRAAVAANGVRALMDFQFRYHPNLLKLRELLAGGEFGAPRSARVHWGEYLPSWHPWEDYRKGYSARRDLGGGVVLTLCHPFDYLRLFIGEVAEVSGSVTNSGKLDIEVEDQAEARLEFANGAQGYVTLNYLEQPTTHWFDLEFERGKFHWEVNTGVLDIYRAETDAWEHIPPPPDLQRNDVFLAVMRHFLDVVAGRAEADAPLEDGIRVLQIALAVHQSAEEGKPLSLAP